MDRLTAYLSAYINKVIKIIHFIILTYLTKLRKLRVDSTAMLKSNQ